MIPSADRYASAKAAAEKLPLAVVRSNRGGGSEVAFLDIFVAGDLRATVPLTNGAATMLYLKLGEILLA